MNRKQRGDATPYVRGVDRRDFIRCLGTSSAVASLAVGTLNAPARSNTAIRSTGNIMLEQLDHATFAGQVGSTFDVTIAGQAVPFELIEARLLNEQPNRPTSLSRREPFSIIFRAPRGTHAPQQIFHMAHAEIGAFGVFLVPLGPDDKGMRYQAVFN